MAPFDNLLKSLAGAGFQYFEDAGAGSLRLLLLARNGETGRRSGINWGQRPGRDHDQMYIPVPSWASSLDFFPPRGSHFHVKCDDGHTLVMNVQQDGGKAMSTPEDNSLLGAYFRMRLGVPGGAFVSRKDLERYGRTDVGFFKLGELTYFMDFSVKKG